MSLPYPEVGISTGSLRAPMDEVEASRRLLSRMVSARRDFYRRMVTGPRPAVLALYSVTG